VPMRCPMSPRSTWPAYTVENLSIMSSILPVDHGDVIP
jgi:hypothetical protein